ncbi:MAG: RNA polymerase sigma factor [Planctomycetes bacterium]|nr:RNA polymerase sigma factor [Planctomycetota bacterium]
MSRDRDGRRLASHERRLRLLVMHLCGRSLRARTEPEDVVQEVYLRAVTVENLPATEDELWRLLARIARNTVVDIARAARASKRDAIERRLARSDWTRFDAVEPAAATAGPRTRLQFAELQTELEAAFDRLTSEHRRVIGLRQFEGLSARDTARRMGRSEAAVHSLYRRALSAWDEALSWS